MIPRSVALALLLSGLCMSTRAEAADEPGARAADPALVASALAAYDRGDYVASLSLLQRAARSAPCLTVRLYLARTRAALGKLVEAADDYRSVVASADRDERSPVMRRAVENAIDELAQLRPRIPSVHVALGEAEQRSRNLRLVLDGSLITFGSRVALDPGHHEVVASDADGEQARLSFDIKESEEKTVDLSWRSAFGGPGKPAELVLDKPSARRTWGIVALGVGATGLGVGTVTGIAALNRYSAAEAHCPANHCSEGAPHPEDSSAFKALRTISAAGYIVGAAGIGTWLGLLLTTPTSKDEHARVSRWTPVVGVGSAGARYVF